MYHTTLVLLVFIHNILVGSYADINKIFEIEWTKFPIPKNLEKVEILNLTSSMGEKYSCLIPRQSPENFPENLHYQGPLAIDFIEYLFNKGLCSYRLDTYWTYEVCHGKYIRKYHEILVGTRLRIQQYTLGQMGIKEQEMVLKKLKEQECKSKENNLYKLPLKKVGNVDLPYVEILMTDGSPCDFNKRRLTESTISYICDLKGNNDIHSVKEVTSCRYEIIILTPLLCAHPKYKPKKKVKNVIACHAIGTSSKLPYNLAQIYSDRKRIINEAFRSEASNELITYDKNTSNLLKFPKMITNFLSGNNCISGGTGAWKYEFCYGTYVNQYTYGILGLKTTVCLGKFNLRNHMDWIKNHPYKRPKPVEHRTYITQLYSDGCVSNVTGRPRQTEVKLRCMENADNLDSLGMYLHETNFGEYLLGIESPILCQIIQLADKDGLIFIKT